MRFKIFVLGVLILCANHVFSQQADIDTLFNRTYNDIVSSGFIAKNIANDLLKIDTLTGRFKDLNYVFNAKTNDIAVAYSPRTHQDRALEMAIAYVTNKAGNTYYHNANLLKNLKLILNDNVGRTHTTIFAWSPNWFDTYIACPERYASSLILLKSALTTAEFNTYKAQLRDVIITKNDKSEFQFINGGANTIWAAQVSIKKGILENKSAIIDTAFSFITSCLQYMYIEKVHLDGEGIKVDFSYHMHGSQLYMAGYGLGFITDMLVCIKQAKGTKYSAAFTKDKMLYYSRLILEGHQYFVFHKSYDWNTAGRQITSPTITNIELPASIINDAALFCPDQATELHNFAKYISGQALINNIGSKYFYKSATLASTASNYHLNVKMTSVHVEGTERMTNCGYRNQNMALGSTPILTKGNEYTNIYPSWDWTRIPGTTTEINQLKVLTSSDSSYWVQASKNPYSGGLAQGSNGIAAFSMKAGENDPDVGITFRKAYFMFDGSLICIGNGITASKTNSIVTSVNQCLSANNASYFDGAEKSITAVQTTTFNNNLQWAFHENVGYIFPNGGNVVISNKDQSGSWYDINHSYGKNIINNRVFSLWIDHSKTPNNATYEYIVKPGISLAELKTYISTPLFETVANTAIVQAVKSDVKNVFGAVFYQAGTVDFKNGIQISVDKPSILLFSGTSPNYTLTISDPLYVENQVITVTINQQLTGPNSKIVGNNTVITCNMPKTNYKGLALTNIYSKQTIAPTVTITAPLNNTSICKNTSINLQANASDADGTVTSVTFYDGTTLIGTDNTAPYSIVWNNQNEGSHSITAIATDNSNVTTTSAAIIVQVNPLPTITPYVRINTLAWQNVSNITAIEGDNVSFGPQPSIATGWTWTGPNNFTSTLRNPIVSTISQLQNGTYTAKYTDAAGCSSSQKTVLTVLKKQSIALNAGWNLISINLYQQDSSIAKVFAGLDVQEIKTATGFWIKGQNPAFNSLQTIEAGKGYLVKMNVAGILNISGTQSVETLHATSLPKGWNLIGCPYHSTTLFSTLFNALNTTIIKNFEGFWIPNGTINSIQNLEPGKGYFIKKQ